MSRVLFLVCACLTTIGLIAVPGSVTAQRAAADGVAIDLATLEPTGVPAAVDGPCFDYHVRFANCGNGTVTDTATGVIWLHDAGCFGPTDWVSANEAVKALGNGQCGLSDGSSPGDWRLATADEWNEIVDASCPFGSPLVVGNQTGGGCFEDAPWATGLVNAFYWTSSSSKGAPTFGADFAYVADLFVGGLSVDPKVRSLGYGWPVRSSD